MLSESHNQKNFSVVHLLVILLLPFSGWVSLKNRKLLGLIAIYLILLFALMILNRWIAHPLGLIIVLGHILAALIIAPVVALTSNADPKPVYFRHILLSLIVLLSFWALLTNREDTLGINVFFIPSESMTPTLLPGDIILVDSWHYLTNPVKRGDIVVFEAPYAHITMVKRVKEVRKNSVSVAGDNNENALTNSRLNGVAITNLRGKARFVLANINNTGTNDRIFRILD